MSETYEQPEPRRQPGEDHATPTGATPDPVRPDRAPNGVPADDDEPGLSPALESEGGGENRRRTDRGIESA